MNFQDIVEKNKEQLELMKKLSDFFTSIKNAIDEFDNLNGILYLNCYNNTINGISGVARSKYINLREKIIAIDGYELKDTINKIREIYSNECIQAILDHIEISYKELIRIRKLNNDIEIAKNYMLCGNVLNNIKLDFDKLWLLLVNTNLINKDISKGVENAPLKIRSNAEQITEESFNSIVNPIKIMYTQICMILNIKEEDYPLEIIRVESGSWNVNFNMNFDVGKIISEILSKFHDFFVRNFTKKGAKINIAESYELIDKEVNIVKIMDEVGIDTSELKPIVKETAVNIFKQTNVFLTANPDVKINDKVLNRSEDTKKLLNTPKYLGYNEDKNN